MPLVLFDCDGTLADSFALICETMRRTFLSHGLDAPADAATRGVIGLSLDTAIRRMSPELDAALVAQLVETYRATFRETREDLSFREALFPGIAGLLARLERREEVRLGLVTGKTRRGVDAVCAAHGLERSFVTIRTADDCPSKPSPAMVLECCVETGIAPTDAIVVGDAIYDMAMARAAGATALGVTWGASGRSALMEAGAHHVVDDVDALSAHLDGWIARKVEAA